MREYPFKVVEGESREAYEARMEARRAEFMSQVEKFAKERNLDIYEVIHHYALYMGIDIDELIDPKTKDSEVFTNRLLLKSYWEQIDKDLVIDDLKATLAAAERAANTDSLTGLANLRAGKEKMSHMISSGSKFSLILLDLDYFKLFNDEYGHEVGNIVLKTVAEIIQSNIRHNRDATDMAFRYGGEELAIIVDDSEEIATIMAERIRKTIHEEAVKAIANRNIASKKLASNIDNVSLSASFGVTEYNPVSDEDIEAAIHRLIDQADSALYDSKNAGRNRVTVYDTEMKTN